MLLLFPIWAPFISFSHLNALINTSSILLNMGGEIGHPCHVCHLRGTASKLSVLSMMLTVCLSYMAFIMLNFVLSIFNSLSLYNKVEFFHSERPSWSYRPLFRLSVFWGPEAKLSSWARLLVWLSTRIGGRMCFVSCLASVAICPKRWDWRICLTIR